MGIRVRTQSKITGLVYSEPFVHELEFTADVSAADAQALPIIVPRVRDDKEWTMWQVKCRFTAGTLKTGYLYVHARDLQTREWHAFAALELLDAPAVTPDIGQIFQFEAPACSDQAAIAVDFNDQDSVLYVTIRGCSYCEVSL